MILYCMHLCAERWLVDELRGGEPLNHQFVPNNNNRFVNKNSKRIYALHSTRIVKNKTCLYRVRLRARLKNIIVEIKLLILITIIYKKKNNLGRSWSIFSFSIRWMRSLCSLSYLIKNIFFNKILQDNREIFSIIE